MAKPIKRQTWSNIDVFGLINGLAIWDSQYRSLRYVRKPFENNLSIKDRIYANHDYVPDVDKQGVINGVSNEFGVTPYNAISKSIFELTYNPIPSGAPGVQDISGYYMDSNGEWQSLGTQIWSDGYEVAKNNSEGFIVWQNSRFANISGYKNFSYSNIVEILRPLPDETQVKFEYYLEAEDEDLQTTLIRYTDMNNQTDSTDYRFTYRAPTSNPTLTGNVVVYTLDDIPSDISNTYYYNKDNGMAKPFTYSLKEYFNDKFKHTWNKARESTTIWDVHKNYGSGEIPSFYDALAPDNCGSSGVVYNGYRGGVEALSYSVYPEELTEQSGLAQIWYLKIYPGRLYIDGIPFYYFENPQTSQLTFTSVSGTLEADLPSGLERGMYTIMANSGYYDSYLNQPQDEFLSGVYEDYCYFTGEDGDSCWSYIYRRRPYLTTVKGGLDTSTELGEYRIDFHNKKIYTTLPSGFENTTLVWDNTLVPTGFFLPYDFNPLNDQNLTFEKFFVYLAIDSNRR